MPSGFERFTPLNFGLQHSSMHFLIRPPLFSLCKEGLNFRFFLSSLFIQIPLTCLPEPYIPTRLVLSSAIPGNYGLYDCPALLDQVAGRRVKGRARLGTEGFRCILSPGTRKSQGNKTRVLAISEQNKRQESRSFRIMLLMFMCNLSFGVLPGRFRIYKCNVVLCRV